MTKTQEIFKAYHDKPMTIQQKQNEAIRRMRCLGLNDYIDDFKKGKLHFYASNDKLLDYIDDRLIEKIREFEEKYNCVVYYGKLEYWSEGLIVKPLLVSNPNASSMTMEQHCVDYQYNGEWVFEYTSNDWSIDYDRCFSVKQVDLHYIIYIDVNIFK